MSARKSRKPAEEQQGRTSGAGPGSPPPVGEILARVRRERGLSLQGLARVSGVSKSMISQVENGQVNPTLALVWKLATGLGVGLDQLLSIQTENEVRAAEVELLSEENCPTLLSESHGYRIQILSTLEMVEDVELYLVELRKGGAIVSESHGVGAFETLTVLQGAIDIELDGMAGSKTRLKTLESARYPADRAHTLRAVPGKDALAYLAVCFGKG